MDISDVNSSSSVLLSSQSLESLDQDHGDQDKIVKSQLDVHTNENCVINSTQDLQKFVEVLTCTACKQLLRPPTLFCFKGHSFCSACTMGVTMCPVCDEVTGCGNNILLDKIIHSLPLPCQYSSFGCTAILSYSQRDRHEMDDCNHKPYKCVKCNEIMDLENCESHYKLFCLPQTFSYLESFKVQELDGNRRRKIFDEQVCLNVSYPETNYIHVFKINGIGVFMRRMVKKNGEWYVWISCAKCTSEAKVLTYKMDVESNGYETYSQSYSGSVVSFFTPDADIFQTLSCLRLDDAAINKAKDSKDVVHMHSEILTSDTPSKKSKF